MKTKLQTLYYHRMTAEDTRSDCKDLALDLIAFHKIVEDYNKITYIKNIN
jgi:hypothetical protein